MQNGFLSRPYKELIKEEKQKAKCLSDEALQIAEKRRDAKGREKRKHIPI